jgi:hypothetical protein
MALGKWEIFVAGKCSFRGHGLLLQHPDSSRV